MAFNYVLLATLIAVSSAGNPQYSFGYGVQDPWTGDVKSQVESRSGDVVKGQYSLIDSDGTRRVVDYASDALNGFNAVVRKEPLAVAAAPIVAAPVVPAVRSAPLIAPAPVVRTAPVAVAAPAATSYSTSTVVRSSPIAAPAVVAAPAWAGASLGAVATRTLAAPLTVAPAWAGANLVRSGVVVSNTIPATRVLPAASAWAGAPLLRSGAYLTNTLGGASLLRSGGAIATITNSGLAGPLSAW